MLYRSRQVSGRLLSKIGRYCTKSWIFRFWRPGFSFLFFWDPFLDGWTAVLKNLGLHSALFVSLGLFSLEVAGRVLEVSSLLALVGLPWVLVVRENTLPAKLFLLEASSLLALVTMLSRLFVLHMWSATSFLLEISSLLVLLVLLGCGSLLRVLMQWIEDILMDGLAVMVRSSVLREDGGHLAPCRGRLGRFGTFTVVCLRT